jgi:type IV pilus assembly protein PilP
VTRFFFAIAALAFAAGCGSSKPTPPPQQNAPPPAQPAPVAAPTGSAALTGDGGLPVNKGVEYTENDFVDSDHSRDPFRSFLTVEGNKGPKIERQYDVKLPEYSIDELRLVGIVMSGDGPRAMFKDPKGVGHVIRTGMYMCRPELVRVGGTNGPEYELSWRVERIRDGDVVFIREDKAQPQIPPATKVVPLHPELKQPG